MRLIVSVGVVLAAPALAQVPNVLGYQGRLIKSDGTPEAGVVAMTLALFDAPTGGAPLACDAGQVALNDGFYALLLGGLGNCPGGGQAISSTVFDGRDLYLELTVAGFALSPRQRIGSVAYALRAATARNVAGGTVDASSIRIGGTTVIDSTGKLAGPAATPALVVGDGLTGQATTADPLKVNFAGSGAAATASRTDHAHPAGDAATLGGIAPTGYILNGTTAQTASFNVTGTGAVGGALTVAGNVGIGTTAPAAKLDVVGGLKIGTVSPCAAADAGTIRWSGTNFEGCNGTAWVRLDFAPRIVPDGLALHLDAANGPSLQAFPDGTTVPSGTRWKDFSGLGNHGAINSSSLLWRAASGGGLDHNGSQTSNYVLLDHTLAHGRSVWTVEVWITPNNITDIDTLWTAGPGNNMLFYMGGGNWTFDNVAGATVAHGMTNGTPYHVAFVAPAPAVLQYYRDGSLAGTFSPAISTAVSSASNQLMLGQEQDCAGGCFEIQQAWKGRIHVVRFYTRGLTAAEVRANFEAERGRFGK